MMMDRDDERACEGADTISREGRGGINEEMRECLACGAMVRWDLVDAPFFGFKSSCDKPKTKESR